MVQIYGAEPYLEVAKPRVFGHVYRSVINGAVAAFAAIFLLFSGLHLDRDKIGVLHVIALVVGLLFLAAFVRGLQALFLARPHFRISRDGLDLRFWSPGVWPANQLLPWLGVVERFIPWSDLKGCRTFTRTSNGGTDFKALMLDTPSGTHEIGWDVFATNIDQIQKIVLNYHEREIRQPARRVMQEAATPQDDGEFPESLPTSTSAAPDTRFAAPVEVHWVGRRNRGAIIALSVMLGVAVAAMGAAAFAFPSMACFGLPFVLVLGAGLVLSIMSTHYGASGQRLLRLTEAGIEKGDGPNQLALIPWNQVEFVRIDYLTVNNAPLNKLRIHLRDQPPIELPDTYDMSLEALADLIDPER